MNRFLKKLKNKLLVFVEERLLDVIFLHQMSITPAEIDRFFLIPHPGKEEVSRMVRIARLKYLAEP